MGKALDAAVKVRSGPNSKGSLTWFHAFCLSVLTAFAGGLFNNIWLGKHSAFLSNDVAIAATILTFVVVNYIPFGLSICQSMPVAMITLSASQLFQSLGLIKFLKAGFETFPASPYYEIPVLGPILFATLLLNMGPFVMKGLEGHVREGMAWNVQAGLFGSSFYLFYVLDTKGTIGAHLRSIFPAASMLGLENAEFATAFISLFFQIMGILQLPYMYGPSFSPFSAESLSKIVPISTSTRNTESDAKKEEIKEDKDNSKKEN